MRVKTDDKILKIKPLLKEFLDELLKEYEYASILACSSNGKSYSANKVGTQISDNPRYIDFGVCIKVYDKKGYAEYSCNEVTKETLEKAKEKIAKSLVPLAGKLPEGLEESAYGMLPDEKVTLCEATEYEIHPFEYGEGKIVEELDKLVKDALSRDERIINAASRYAFKEYTNMFLSKNKDMIESVMYSDGMIFIEAKDGEIVRDSYKGFSVLGGVELLKSYASELDDRIDTALALLKAEPMVPGEYECICAPDVTGMIVHEAFGHGVEMDMFVKKRALAEKFVGKRVASDLVTMRDGAKGVNQTATYFFDDEGTLAHNTLVIDKGILVTGYSDLQSAMRLGTEPTGNGRRQDHSRKAYTRMTNTYFEPGKDKVEDMIKSIKYGFYLGEASSGMEDPKNWGIQCMVSYAKEIKDGEFTGKIFAPICLTGYVPDLLQSISMMSDETILSGSGFCGKGYKEWAKVSDGGPYIKAKIRLG
ncbi:MAG: TldD/PmbA family protein [Lachnospiraceae bacterium]|nr:TldD/PmbA family protein [Lachnospiraceae bacterium]